jgi:hypothetical protein
VILVNYFILLIYFGLQWQSKIVKWLIFLSVIFELVIIILVMNSAVYIYRAALGDDHQLKYIYIHTHTYIHHPTAPLVRTTRTWFGPVRARVPTPMTERRRRTPSHKPPPARAPLDRDVSPVVVILKNGWYDLENGWQNHKMIDTVANSWLL